MRNTLIYTVGDDGGRDKGKRFKLTEMPAMQAEKWALRALMLLGRSGLDLGPESLAGGWQTVAVLGFQALARMNFDEAEPLFDEMLSCIEVMPDPNNNMVLIPFTTGVHVEEVRTIMNLRMEVFKLHMGFSSADAPSK